MQIVYDSNFMNFDWILFFCVWFLLSFSLLVFLLWVSQKVDENKNGYAEWRYKDILFGIIIFPVTIVFLLVSIINYFLDKLYEKSTIQAFVDWLNKPIK